MILGLNDVEKYIQLSESNSINHRSVTTGSRVQSLAILF